MPPLAKIYQGMITFHKMIFLSYFISICYYWLYSMFDSIILQFAKMVSHLKLYGIYENIGVPL